MDLNYRINMGEVLPVLQDLEMAYIELAKLPDSQELEDFCDAFNDAVLAIGHQAEAMGFYPEEAIGYFKVKSYLEMTNQSVTISKEEYEKLKFDSERLKDLED